MVSFPVACTEKRVHTRTSAFEHGLNMVEQCISMYVHENMKMPQESWPPARAVLRGFIHCMTVYVHMGKFLYHSIVDTDYKGCTGAPWWYSHKMCGTHVQRIHMSIQCMYTSIQCMYMYHICTCLYIVCTCIYNVCTSTTHVQCMYMSIHCMHMYIQCMYMVSLFTTLTSYLNRF